MMLAKFEAAMRRGSLRSNEELFISALVVAPFVLTMVILLYRIGWAPTLEFVLLTVVVQITATVWNAGWRAGGPGGDAVRPQPHVTIGLEGSAG